MRKKSSDAARSMYENRLAEALIRFCYKCRKPFVKTDGCNKITWFVLTNGRAFNEYFLNIICTNMFNLATEILGSHKHASRTSMNLAYVERTCATSAGRRTSTTATSSRPASKCTLFTPSTVDFRYNRER